MSFPRLLNPNVTYGYTDSSFCIMREVIFTGTGRIHMAVHLRRIVAFGIAGLGLLVPHSSGLTSLAYQSYDVSATETGSTAPRVGLMAVSTCAASSGVFECSVTLLLMPGMSCRQCSGVAGCSTCRSYQLMPPKRCRRIPPTTPASTTTSNQTERPISSIERPIMLPTTLEPTSMSPPLRPTTTPTSMSTADATTATTGIVPSTAAPPPISTASSMTITPTAVSFTITKAPTGLTPPSAATITSTTPSLSSTTHDRQFTSISTPPPATPLPTRSAQGTASLSTTPPSPTQEPDDEDVESNDDPSKPTNLTAPRRSRSPRRTSTTPQPPTIPPTASTAAPNQPPAPTAPPVLSSGAIAGIAVGAVAICLSAMGGYMWKKTKKVHADVYREMLLSDHTTGSGQYLAML